MRSPAIAERVCAMATERGASWGHHIRATLVLGLPLIGSQLATIGLGVTDTIMLGWLPIVAEAMGAENPVAVRRSVRMGLWASTLFAVIAIPFLLSGGAILRALGQVPELTVMADDYLDIAAYAILLTLWHNVLRSYFSSLDRAGFGNWGAPALGIQGAAVATLGTSILVTSFMLVYALREPILRKYEIFVRFWRPDWSAFGEVMRLGWPISLMLLAEVSLFSLSSIMMGWIGTIELAAHGIALQVVSVIFMIPLGLAFAGTVRIGQAYGRKDGGGLRRARGRDGDSCLWHPLARCGGVFSGGRFGSGRRLGSFARNQRYTCPNVDRLGELSAFGSGHCLCARLSAWNGRGWDMDRACRWPDIGRDFDALAVSRVDLHALTLVFKEFWRYYAGDRTKRRRNIYGREQAPTTRIPSAARLSRTAPS